MSILRQKKDDVELLGEIERFDQKCTFNPEDTERFDKAFGTDFGLKLFDDEPDSVIFDNNVSVATLNNSRQTMSFSPNQLEAEETPQNMNPHIPKSPMTNEREQSLRMQNVQQTPVFFKTNHTAQVSPFGPPPLSVNRNRNTTNHRRSDSYDPHNMTPLFFRQDPTSLRKRRPENIRPPNLRVSSFGNKSSFRNQSFQKERERGHLVSGIMPQPTDVMQEQYQNRDSRATFAMPTPKNGIRQTPVDMNRRKSSHSGRRKSRLENRKFRWNLFWENSEVRQTLTISGIILFLIWIQPAYDLLNS